MYFYYILVQKYVTTVHLLTLLKANLNIFDLKCMLNFYIILLVINAFKRNLDEMYFLTFASNLSKRYFSFNFIEKYSNSSKTIAL